MTYTRYFTLILAAVLLMAFSTVNPEKEKKSNNAKQKTGTAQVQPAKKKEQTRRSSWLNEKNFPMYKDSGCPFYFNRTAGC